MSQRKYVLTEANKEYLLENWDKFDIMTLAQNVSGNKFATGKTVEGRACKEFLGAMGHKPKTTDYIVQDKQEALTPEQIELIRNNSKDISSTLELTRLVFNDESLSSLHNEFKLVYQFMKDNNVAKEIDDEPVEENEYRCPKSVYTLVPRINKHMKNPLGFDIPMFDKEKLTPSDEKNLKALLSYMQIPRFSHLATQYKKQIDRNVYESTFIGMTYDKSDLSREEQEQYISLAVEITNTTQMERKVQKLDQQLDEMFRQSSDDDNKKKLSMTLVELIASERDRLDKSKERQKKLMEKLNVSRADRQKLRVEASSSFLKLVDMWKRKEDRDKIIEMAKKKREGLVKEVERLSSIDSLRAEIFGIDPDNIIL